MKSQILPPPDIEGIVGDAWACNQENCNPDDKRTKDLAIFVLRTFDEKYSVVCVQESSGDDGNYFDLLVLDDEPISDSFDPRDTKNIRVGLWPEIFEPVNVDSKEKALNVAKSAVQRCLDGYYEPIINDQAKWHQFIQEQSVDIAH